MLGSNSMQHLQPNTTLQGGKYRIERVLGQGGFGITYEGYNTEFEETVAIKEFFLKGVTERDETTRSVSVSNSENVPQFEEQREKFKKEARRLRKLKNEHIVKVHDLFEENGTAYYVMEHIDGESLAERMKRIGKPLAEQEVRTILQQILEALEEVHQNEIWHLDLKPGNIMLDKQGNAYLIDFGASKLIRADGSFTTSTALCYTPGYAPNEQIGQMFDRFGPWTDFYALGATIYHLLTNKQPPMAIDIEEDEEDAFNFPDSVSTEMRSLVKWMMQPKRKARPQKVEEITAKMSTAETYYRNEIQLLDDNNEATVILGDENRKSIPDNIELSNPNEDLLFSINREPIDLGLSVCWADCNVGSTTESIEGGLYGWADPTGTKTSKLYGDYLQLMDRLTLHVPYDLSGSKNDIATAQWGEPWRMPTKAEWTELLEKCKWEKVEIKGAKGYRVEGPNGNSIFLPYTGIRCGEYVSNKDAGYYWTSERVKDEGPYAFYFYFDKEGPNEEVNSRNFTYTGRAIRPVQNKS